MLECFVNINYSKTNLNTEEDLELHKDTQPSAEEEEQMQKRIGEGYTTKCVKMQFAFLV